MQQNIKSLKSQKYASKEFKTIIIHLVFMVLLCLSFIQQQNQEQHNRQLINSTPLSLQQMKQFCRSSSYNQRLYRQDPQRSIIQRRLMKPFKQEFVVSQIKRPSLRSSQTQIQKQKCSIHQSKFQNFNGLNKSADVAYFIERQRVNSNKSEEQQNVNYAYIGQIQALQRRKFGRKFFYKRQNVDKSVLNYVDAINSPQKHNQTNKLDKIVVNEIKNIPSRSTELIQIQVEELHYSMVIVQQKCKKSHDI